MTSSRERPLLVTISLVYISAGQPHRLEPGALQRFSAFFTAWPVCRNLSHEFRVV